MKLENSIAISLSSNSSLAIFQSLIKETSLLYDNYVDSTFIKYRGIRVYRSLDVIEGIFEVK